MQEFDESAVRAVIFDMDGTLFDTEVLYYRAFVAVLIKQGIEMDEAFYHANLAGTTNRHIEEFLVETHGDRFDLETYRKSWPRELKEIIDREGLPFMPDVEELMEELGKTGLPLAVASSSCRQEIEDFLGRAGIRERFDAVAGGDEVDASKPAPDIFVLAAQRLGVEARGCLVIEDSNHGVLGASRAGMKVMMRPGPAGANDTSREVASFPEDLVAEVIACVGGAAAG